MKKHDLKKCGVPNGCLDLAEEFCAAAARKGLFRDKRPHDLIDEIMGAPESYVDDVLAGRFAKQLIEEARLTPSAPVTYKVWGEDQIELGAIDQLRSACQLPVSVKAALMPDAHVGYGLPIGGVLATANAVIPYAVGVDIACRMRLTVLDLPHVDLERKPDDFKKALEKNTVFGVGQEYTRSGRRNHDVMDKDWSVSPVTELNKDLAWKQLGTSGSGNHFVEFGLLEWVETPHADHPVAVSKQLAVPQLEYGKKYIAILSHSGSRAAGARVCDHYSKLAMKLLPSKYADKFKHLAWLHLDTQEGKEYWDAMNLMGEYAAANHAIIHQQIVKHLGAGVAFSIENHHNFAWKEQHDGIEVVVHRKGATPAGQGVYGVIPGSMADPAFIVRGLGAPESLGSASHGAGRKKPRKYAKATESWDFWKPELKRRGVTLLGAGLDEVPSVYKNIGDVMQRQQDLVEIVARFQPKIVRMSDDGKSED